MIGLLLLALVGAIGMMVCAYVCHRKGMGNYDIGWGYAMGVFGIIFIGSMSAIKEL